MDLMRVCRQAMNKATTKRLISKQEAVVLLAELPLTLCTESIESVSISNSKRLRSREDRDTDKTFVTAYAKRAPHHESMNMSDYYHLHKNGTESTGKYYIPNFVGVNGTPKFPVTEAYARHTLIVYKPWRDYPHYSSENIWKQQFDIFINSNSCPIAAKIPYERVLRRAMDKMTHYETKASDCDHSGNPISADDKYLMDLTGLKAMESEKSDYDASLIRELDKGILHKWDKKPKVSKKIQQPQNVTCNNVTNPIFSFSYATRNGN